VPVRDLLDLVGAPPDADVEVESLQRSGAYRLTELQHQFARDPLTLLALELNGDVLTVDHGFPCRIIAPDRPGVLQTKWVSRIEVLA
jgi:DMSO/TMAO reductase YedYZ molybdopterin-dependent catalytic subunit